MSHGYVWVTHAPADYVMCFLEKEHGPHSVVSGVFASDDDACGIPLVTGAELNGPEARVYCTLLGEAATTEERLWAAGALEVAVQTGIVQFVAFGDGTMARLIEEAIAERPERLTTRFVISRAADRPRMYREWRQCQRCGELRGRINVLPTERMLIDTRRLACRCASVPCRYCETGRVRAPLTEHFDPEFRAGHMPAFGYLVPCGDCQAAGRGPRVVMSTPLP